MKRAFKAGFVAGLGVAGFLLVRKVVELQRRGTALEAGLQLIGDEEAHRVAEQTANQYMREVYGITPERIAGAQRLAARLGVSP